MLSIVVFGDEPPSEFRIFTAGKVETCKGTFTFDDAAARSVLAKYADQGNELMVDYDHASLGSSFAPDPAQAGKAAGWFQLELRGGELWAVNVRWTEPAAEALRRKEWRYMSPTFATDDDGRIVDLLNVALTNIPATKKLEPLMAASQRVSLDGGSMDPAKVKEAIEALKNEDGAKALELLESMIASAAGGEETPAEEPPMDEPPPEMTSEDPPAASEDEQATKAASEKLTKLTGKASPSEQLEEIERWRASHVELTEERAKVAKDQAALELSDRRRLIADLVKLGAETPATAWAGDAKKLVPCKRLAAEPIGELRDRVQVLLAARGGKMPTAPKPPTGETHGLSERELEKCKKRGIDPAKYSEVKASMTGRA